MRWDTTYDRYDACYYEIANDENAFKSGKLFIRFTAIDSDISVHVNGGSDYKNAFGVIIEGNEEV